MKERIEAFKRELGPLLPTTLPDQPLLESMHAMLSKVLGKDDPVQVAKPAKAEAEKPVVETPAPKAIAKPVRAAPKEEPRSWSPSEEVTDEEVRRVAARMGAGSSPTKPEEPKKAPIQPGHITQRLGHGRGRLVEVERRLGGKKMGQRLLHNNV